MSIFKRLGGKDTDTSMTEEIEVASDDLPPMDLESYELEDITRSIRSELDYDDDDIEDLAETPAFSSALINEANDALELSTDSIIANERSEGGPSGSDDDAWVSPYVDARGIAPVSREETEAPLETILKDISDAPKTVSEPKVIDLTVEPSPSPSVATDQRDFSLPVKSEDDFSDASFAPMRSQGMNLGELRLDIVRITSDIESGEALYRRAQQRVDSLIGFIEQAEVAVSVLAKMEPENRRLKAENRDLETDVEAQRYKLARLETDLEDQRDMATKAHVKIEMLRSKLTDLNQAVIDAQQDAETFTASNDALKIQTERAKTNLDIETRENITLREKLVELSAYAEDLTDGKIEFQKTIDASARDYGDLKDRNNTLETENAEIRLKLRNAERQNIVMKDEMVEIQQKIVSFKTQHETHLHRRDDKIAALASRNTALENTLKHKEDIIESAGSDVSELRKHNARHNIEREKLEKIIASQNYQLNIAEKKLSQSKQRMTELDERYKDVAEALAMKRLRQSAETRPSSNTVPRAAAPRMADRVSLEQWSESHANPFLTEDNALAEDSP